MDSFAHLHCHSHLSMLDGAAKIDALFTEAERLEMPAVAITDHGNMFGAAEFYRCAKDSPVKGVIGIEAYCAPDSRHKKSPVFWGHPGQRGDDVSGGGAYTHITLLAENTEGLRNLFRLSSLASFQGYYHKPRCDRELLARYSAGVIATTGCPSGEVQTRLRLGQDAEALRAASDYRDIFGQENYFCELMDHGLTIERSVREGLLDIARKLGLRPLATNDSHYVTRDQAKAHDALLCVQTGSKLADEKRFRFEGDGYYLKSAAEMRAYWDAEVPGAADNTLLVADRIEPYDEVFAWKSRSPHVPLEPGDTEDDLLRRESYRGAMAKFGDPLPAVYRDRLDTELDIVARMAIPGYFLVVTDLIRWARSRDIRCRARGSAAGSLIAYTLGITDIDPIQHDLYFERFINPDRVSPPDIDVDVDSRHRGELAGYLASRWGSGNLAQIITFGTIKTRAAITDATRVLGLPVSLGDKVKKALPRPVYAIDIPLSGIFDPAHERYPEAAATRELTADPDCAEVLDTARGLEGLIRQAGVHACGLFLSSEPLADVLPLWKRQDDDAIVTGWDWSACEVVGLLKMDLLGSATLRAIDEALGAIKARHGVTIDLAALPLDDPETYALLARGETLGVFQFEGSSASETLRRMRPSSFADICVAQALHRPGPMEMGAHHEYADRKAGRCPIKPIHPELTKPLSDILDSTFGLIAFQEQIMAIGRRVAGYTLAQADILRRAMGKKKKSILDAEFPRFQNGMRSNGFSDAAIDALWKTMVPFASYSFNYSHAASYGLESYWTAYLKAHYPAEFMAARLSAADNATSVAIYLAECRRMGIKILPPDVSHSAPGFMATDEGIRCGLAAIRDVGESAAAAIIQSRPSGGYPSFAAFLDRIGTRKLSARAIEALTEAGALDSFGHSRRALVESAAAAIGDAAGRAKDDAMGQESLFGPSPAVSQAILDGPEWPPAELLRRERERLGVYVSAHPLDGAEAALRRHARHTIGELLLDQPAPGDAVTVAGMITSAEVRTSKRGKPWAIAVVEDATGQIECRFLGRACAEYGTALARDAVVAISGRVSDDEAEPRVLAERLTMIDLAVPADNPVPTVPFELSLAAADCTPERVAALRGVLERHRGRCETRVRFLGKHRAILLAASDRFRVTPGQSLLDDLRDLYWRTAAYASMDAMGMERPVTPL